MDRLIHKESDMEDAIVNPLVDTLLKPDVVKEITDKAEEKPKVKTVKKTVKSKQKAAPERAPAKPTIEKPKKAVKKVGKKIKEAVKGKSPKSPVLTVLKKTIKSDAIKSLKLSLKPEKIRGVCFVKSCTTKSVTARSLWCKEHKKQIRAEQLRLNNITWHKRVERGTAGHHVAYKNTATQWAVENPDKALALAKKNKSIYDAKKLQEIIQKTKARLKAKSVTKGKKAA